MSFMIDDLRPDLSEQTSAPLDNAADGAPVDFETARAARYERLSLLTLDLAEEAGEAAVNFSHVDNGLRSGRPGRFERRIAAMTRAIWAHGVIERMRTGRFTEMRDGGAHQIDHEADHETEGKARHETRGHGAGPGLPSLPAIPANYPEMVPEMKTPAPGMGPAPIAPKPSPQASPPDRAAPPETTDMFAPSPDEAPPQDAPRENAVIEEDAEEDRHEDTNAPDGGFADKFAEDFEPTDFITEQGEIDEGAIEAAIREAMNAGPAGEVALKQALCPVDPQIGDPKLDDPAAEGASRAPP